MSTFANQLKSEIARISKKEIKAENAALKKASSHYRTEIASLKRRLSALESSLSRMAKHSAGSKTVEVDEDGEKSLRFRPAGFAKLRQKLGVTANEMGTLLGVTGQSVYKWEKAPPDPARTNSKPLPPCAKWENAKWPSCWPVEQPINPAVTCQRSNVSDTPMPPPMHNAASPFWAPLRCIS